jgi:hypothetical protein
MSGAVYSEGMAFNMDHAGLRVCVCVCVCVYSVGFCTLADMTAGLLFWFSSSQPGAVHP